MASETWGVAGGAFGILVSVATIGIGQYNRYRDNKRKANELHDKEVANAPDLAVKRLSEALDGLGDENTRLNADNIRLNADNARLNASIIEKNDEIARGQAMYQQSIKDRDAMVGDVRDLKQELEDERTKWNKQNPSPT